MEKKIVSLLNNNLRIIIPDFGAFVIRQQEPRIVVFNELLKNNDGLLLDHIMKTENVDCDVAQQLLGDYTNHALKTLDSGGIVTIEGIGTLKKDQKGKIIFTSENEVPDTEPITSTKIVREDQLPFDRPDTKTFATPSTLSQKKPMLDKQLARWIGIFLAANVIVIGFFILKDPVRDMFKVKKPSKSIEESVLNQLADSMMAAVKDTSIRLDEDPAVTLINDVQQSGDGNFRYYIVAGCFRDEINADDLVGSLKNMGYKAEKFGKIGDLYAVSFASFDDKELAVKELARIRKEFHPDAWMTRF